MYICPFLRYECVPWSFHLWVELDGSGEGRGAREEQQVLAGLEGGGQQLVALRHAVLQVVALVADRHLGFIERGGRG